MGRTSPLTFDVDACAAGIITSRRKGKYGKHLRTQCTKANTVSAGEATK